MKFRRLKIITLLIIGSLAGCVDPIAIEASEDGPKVVIDGYFTTDAELNSVRLSRSAGFSNDYPFVPFNAPITGAVVKVHTADGMESYDFFEVGSGVYKTSSIAEVGKSYYLELVLPDNSLYRSQPGSIPDAVDIQSLSFTLEQKTRIEENGGTVLELQQYFFDVYVTVNDLPNISNFYLWRAYGTFEYQTKPVGDGQCLYCFCYAPLYPLLPYVNVFSDKHVDGGSIYKQVAAIKYDRKTGFLTKLAQFSITKEAYVFWNNVHEQQSNVGSIFDPAPTQIRGNVYNPDNTNEQVLGFFTTASISRKHLLIKRGLEADKAKIHESNLLPLEIGDCRPLYAGATHIKPIEFYD
jgi:hypothetical protein